MTNDEAIAASVSGAQAEGEMPRADGYYWIRDEPTDDWDIAYWDGRLWLIFGNDGPRLADPDVLGPRILPPSEPDEADRFAAEFATIRAEAESAERERWLSCARVDAMMEGPALKGWNRSELNRLWLASVKPQREGK